MSDDEIAQLWEIAEAVAAMELEYEDEHSEYFCPGCHAFVGADWGSNRRPYGMTNGEWAENRFKHENDCPIVKARALLKARAT